MPTNSSTWNTKLASMNQHLTKSKPNIVSVVENAENIPHAYMHVCSKVSTLATSQDCKKS